MATYNPPTENLAIFDPAVFTQQDEPLTTAEGDKRYLRFPNAQGTENLATTNVNGVLTANSTTNINGVATFSNNVNIGSAGSSNNTPVLTTNKTNLTIGTGGQGSMNIECPVNVGGFGSITLLNADITMQDDSYINQTLTHTTPNNLYSINLTTGSRIQYPDATQQNSAFTGAGALAGTYNDTNITIDSNGKITAISSGVASSGDADALYLTNTTSNVSTAQFANVNWNISNTTNLGSGRDLQTNSTGQYVFFARNASGYSYSTNYGLSFTTVAGSFATQQTRGGAISANGEYWLIQTGNGTAGDTYYSANYGVSFTGLGISTGVITGSDTNNSTCCMSSLGDYLYSMTLTSANVLTLYRIVRSGAGALTTTTITTFAGLSSFSFASSLRCSANGKYLVFNGFAGSSRVFWSNDYGATWTSVSLPANTTLGAGAITTAISATGEIMLAVLDNGSTGNTETFVSNNYGANWAVVGNVLVNSSAGFVMDRICITGDANIIFTTATNTASETLMYCSNNLGKSWILAVGANCGQRFCACSNDGQVIYSQRPTPDLEICYISMPLNTVASNLSTQVYDFTACPSYFEDFTELISATVAGTLIQYTEGGAGSVTIMEGVAGTGVNNLNAVIALGSYGRLGLIDMNSGTANPSATTLTTDNVYQLSAIKSITYGLNICGNESPTAVANGIDWANGTQYFGISGIAPNSAGTMSGTSIIWRYTSTTTITNWTLVENNVVKETITGTNLSGGQSQKWIRATIYFLNGGTQYYGIWYNLTDGVYYQTAKYTIGAGSNVNTYCCSVMSILSTNATDKHLLVDYVLIEPNTYPIGGTTTAFR